MENNVWSDDAMILPILNNEVVLISLYVDDKRDLPKMNNLFRKQLALKLKQ
jgi:thiol:disulfide interchange protein DsbD